MAQEIGSRVIAVGPIVIGCMAADSRAALDLAMKQWGIHTEQQKRSGQVSRDPVYSFAYWLLRWSGIVTRVNLHATGVWGTGAPGEQAGE